MSTNSGKLPMTVLGLEGRLNTVTSCHISMLAPSFPDLEHIKGLEVTASHSKVNKILCDLEKSWKNARHHDCFRVQLSMSCQGAWTSCHFPFKSPETDTHGAKHRPKRRHPAQMLRLKHLEITTPNWTQIWKKFKDDPRLNGVPKLSQTT